MLFPLPGHLLPNHELRSEPERTCTADMGRHTWARMLMCTSGFLMPAACLMNRKTRGPGGGGAGLCGKCWVWPPGGTERGGTPFLGGDRSPALHGLFVSEPTNLLPGYSFNLRLQRQETQGIQDSARDLEL